VCKLLIIIVIMIVIIIEVLMPLVIVDFGWLLKIWFKLG